MTAYTGMERERECKSIRGISHADGHRTCSRLAVGCA